MSNSRTKVVGKRMVAIPSKKTVSTNVYQLRKIKFIQNIGCFKQCKSDTDANFNLCTLIFGENGWGKSTLADLLRSLTTGDSDIVTGRKTLSDKSEEEAKAILYFDQEQKAVFERNTWEGIKPRIAVYDEKFINENVFSGDIVTKEHLTNQYSTIIGEEGVRRSQRITELTNKNAENNEQLRHIEQNLDQIFGMIGLEGLTREGFLELEAVEDIDAKIETKEAEIQRASIANSLQEAPVAKLLPVPAEAEEFKKSLSATIKDIAESAVQAVRNHIAKHEKEHHDAEMTHEGWLKAGVAFVNEDECAFCGQPLDERILIDSYAKFFDSAYAKLAKNIKQKRRTLARYQEGEFRKQTEEIVRQNQEIYAYWKKTGQIEAPKFEGVEVTINDMEKAAQQLDVVFTKKQGNLTEAIADEDSKSVIAIWEAGRREIIRLNDLIEEHVAEVEVLKQSIDEAELPRLQKALKELQIKALRHKDETIALVKELEKYRSERQRIAAEKEEERIQLNEHSRVIMETLGREINLYLDRLNADFRIIYQKPKHHGKEPAVNYQILINNVPVSPRRTSESLAEPSLRNTLSSGDKSVLALALFLAKLDASPALGETIVVLDDPLTSLDDFRRHFTVAEIKKLCDRVTQTIVLSHNKNFLWKLWKKIGRDKTKCLTIQAGAPGTTTITPYNIESETQSRYIIERIQIKEFVEGEPHEPALIRMRLRTVCEAFYRRTDPSLFHADASLDEIIRIINVNPEAHSYKESIEELNAINDYSRSEHHAEIEGNPSDESSYGELKGCCRKVLELTSGKQKINAGDLED